jgi:putative membrane protein
MKLASKLAISGLFLSMGAAGTAAAGDLTTESFTNKAALGGMTEVELGKLAQEKAENPQVKDFGEMMVEDHGAANEKLKGLADSEGWTLPTTLDSEHKSDIEELAGKKGSEFDRAYIDLMVEDHKKDVELFEQASESDSVDESVQQFAAETLPTLQKHLSTVEEIDSNL